MFHYEVIRVSPLNFWQEWTKVHVESQGYLARLLVDMNVQMIIENVIFVQVIGIK